MELYSEGSQSFNMFCYITNVGRDSVICTATSYGLTGTGSGSQWGCDVPHSFRSALGPTQSPVKLVLGSLHDVKAAGGGVDHLHSYIRRG